MGYNPGMQFDRHQTGPDDADRRLDRIVRRFLPSVPLSSVYRLIRKGFIRVGGKRVAPDATVAEGAEIWIARLPELAESARAPATGPESAGTGPRAPMPEPGARAAPPHGVIIECPDLLVVDKPVGVPVHGKGGLDTLIPQSRAARDSLSFRSGPLHRLDRGTSGLIVFSKTLAGARWFSGRISRHECDKLYLGIVVGKLEGPREWYDETADGKPMITFAEPVALSPSGPERTLVRFRIVTGRKHQIRFQCARHGFPLEGDGRYNTSAKAGDVYFLHAWRLSFGTGERPEGLPETLTSPLPAPFAARVSALFGKGALARLES